MAIKFEILMDQAAETIDYYANRNKQNKAMDAMADSRWTLPEGAEKPGLTARVDPAPANALGVGVKVLSAEKPKPKFTPTGPDPEDRATASKIERGLSWELRNASKRSQTKLVPDINRSSLQYAETAIYIDYLPWRLKGKVSSGRLKRILRQGNFALIPHNPNTVYPRYSPLGLESVLSAQTMKATEVVQYWGNWANELKNYLGDKKKDPDVTVYDYTLDDQRAVWVTTSDHASGDSKTLFKIMDEERERSFIPWAVRMTGTSLRKRPELQRMPFLSTIYRANMWENLNILHSLITSEVLAYAASPRYKIIGPNGELVKIDYGEFNNPVNVPPGHDIVALDTPQIDRALTEILDRYKAGIDAATNVQVLADLSFPAGTAFATVNAVLQTAIASLEPYKTLSEMSLADIFETMLLWIDETDGEIIAYGTGKNDQGEYVVTKEDFDPAAIYLDVELSANAPTDHQQRVATGMQMLQIGYPLARVLEDLNVSDPEQAILERYYEELLRGEVDIIKMQRQMEAQQEFQQPNLQNLQTGGQGRAEFEATQGSQFDPNMAGNSPYSAVPGVGREQIQGVAADGNPLVE